MIELPAETKAEADSVEVYYGPNIKPFPKTSPLESSISAKAVLKVGDNITTDHIMPAGAKILPYRSNIPYLSQFCFRQCDENFAENCKKAESCVIIGGANYGQGSSREHAALVPLYLGVKAVITKSFARIHKANLVNAGIIPLNFKDASDYDKIDTNDELVLPAIKAELSSNSDITLVNKTKNEEYTLICDVSERQKDILSAGSLLDFTKKENN
jgi:aconitate hydratase